jgi:hypothetical protein|tara:strand:- start:75 stop:647 length:573 start_codon:yes stop_codon:yes gene_type:complete
MKKLLGILVLGLLLSGNAYADDIQDFQIEGISIGDSLLKYYSEDEIKSALKVGYYYKDNKFVDVFFYPKSDSVYDDLQITIKPKDDNYKIYVVAAKILYKNNIKDCYSEKEKTVTEVKNIFSKKIKNKKVKRKHNADKSGKSKYESNVFVLNEGYIEATCFDWSKKVKYTDSFMLAIKSDEFIDFMQTAY